MIYRKKISIVLFYYYYIMDTQLFKITVQHSFNRFPYWWFKCTTDCIVEASTLDEALTLLDLAYKSKYPDRKNIQYVKTLILGETEFLLKEKNTFSKSND